jgi:cell pole-organizing protein PopZ
MSFSNNDQPNGGAGEPSMEEILASIRRILKDEAVKSPSAEPDDDILVLDSSMVAKPVDLSTATSPPAAPLPTAESPASKLQSTAVPLHFASEPSLVSPAYTPPPSAPEPDVLLTPAALPEPEPETEPLIVPLKPAGLGPPPVAPVFGGRPLSDYPVMNTDMPAVAPTPAPAPPAPEIAPSRPFFAAPLPTPAAPPPPVASEPAAPPITVTTAAVPPIVTSPVMTPPPVAPPDQAGIAAKQPPSEIKMPDNQDNFQPPASLVSDQVTSAAANSIGAMLRSMTAEKSVAISRQGVTIEDMVRDEIRPLLKAWLDTNLAGLVERVVRSEIEKVMERSAG